MKTKIFRKQTIIQCLLLVLAIAFGGSAAMAFDITPHPDATPDEAGLPTDLSGGVLSLTNDELANLTQEEIDKHVGQFYADAFVLDGIVRSSKNVIKNQNNKITFYSFAQKVRKFAIPTGQEITAASKVSVKTMTLSSTVAKSFKKTDLVHFLKIKGYSEPVNGTQTAKGYLTALVTDKTDTTVTFTVINGVLDSTVKIFPDVPAGTEMLVGLNALAESQKVVDPFLTGLVGEERFLQKSGFNIVRTEKEIQAALKIPGMANLIEQAAMKEHRRSRTYNLIMGVQGAMLVQQDENMGEEYVRFAEGILAQTKIAFTLDDTQEMSYTDLLAISKAQHANIFSTRNSVCLCGRNRIEKISRIKYFQETTDVAFQNLNIGKVIDSYKDVFGRIEFKYEPLMDEIGLTNVGILFEPDAAVRYVSRNGNTSTEEVNKREAQRTIFIEEEAYFLRNYSSMLIGSSQDLLDLEGISDPEITITDVATLPTTPTDGQVVHLTAANGGFDKDSILIYNATTAKWSHYEGIINS